MWTRPLSILLRVYILTIVLLLLKKCEERSLYGTDWRHGKRLGQLEAAEAQLGVFDESQRLHVPQNEAPMLSIHMRLELANLRSYSTRQRRP